MRLSRAIRMDQDGLIVWMLERDARNATELALLIDAYRRNARLRSACTQMTAFVERHPSDPRAAEYTQWLTETGPYLGRPRIERTTGGTPDLIGHIRTWEGRTRSPEDLASLIEAYAEMGNSRAACRDLELFSRRYPRTLWSPRTSLSWRATASRPLTEVAAPPGFRLRVGELLPPVGSTDSP